MSPQTQTSPSPMRRPRDDITRMAWMKVLGKGLTVGAKWLPQRWDWELEDEAVGGKAKKLSLKQRHRRQSLARNKKKLLGEE